MSSIKEIIFVDESGDPGLSRSSKIRSPYFAYGFVFCRDPTLLRKNLRRLLRRLHRRDKYPKELRELKFYLPSKQMKDEWGYTQRDINRYVSNLPSIRNKSIDITIKSACAVFSSILRKSTIRRQTWTSETIGNFLFAQTLYVNILNRIRPPIPPTIIFDKGRLSAAKTHAFQDYMVNKEGYFGFKGFKKYEGLIGVPVDMPSLAEPGLWSADIVAGAFTHKYKNKDPSYADRLSPIYIGMGERRYWF